MTDRWLWWILAGLAAAIIICVYVQHQRCPKCQRRWEQMLRTCGNALIGWGQQLVGRSGV